MAKKEKTKDINLLPQEEIENSTFGRTLKWLLTSFRYIVIATEMVVMSAFLARFWLDARSSSLVDGINQKKAIISSYSTFEDEFRKTQNRLNIFSEYASINKKVSPVTESIRASLPSDITLSQIAIDGEKLTITGQTTNENSISNLVTLLNRTNSISGTKVFSITSKEDGTLKFTLSATIKERTNASTS